MNRSKVFVTFLVLVLALFVAQDVNAQQKKSAKKMATQEEMMKNWQAAMTPGAAHKKLEAMVGTWDAEVKSWMSGPDGEPTISKATSQTKLVLGGRYLMEEVSGEMMNQPFNGVGYTGYDNVSKKYVGFWIDNMGTGMSLTEGHLDKDGKTYIMWGKMDDPMTGEKGKKIKYVTKVIDNDSHTFEIYDVSEHGDKKPTMTITYTRRKS